MPRYRLHSAVTASAYTEVIADSREQALEVAARRRVELVGYSGRPRECWVIEDADVEPHDIRIEEYVSES
jgi:hypothetical protein